MSTRIYVNKTKQTRCDYRWTLELQFSDAAGDIQDVVDFVSGPGTVVLTATLAMSRKSANIVGMSSKEGFPHVALKDSAAKWLGETIGENKIIAVTFQDDKGSGSRWDMQ